MWIARPDVDTTEMAAILSAARGEGLRQLAQIAGREAMALQISGELARHYLCENLHFTLGRKEREGLRRFYRLCVAHGLAPRGLECTLEGVAHDCPAS
jgi:chorismate dehydratase